MNIKPILGTAVGLGSLALVSHSAKMVKDSLKQKPIKTKNLVKGASKIIVGTSLLSATSKIVGDINE